MGEEPQKSKKASVLTGLLLLCLVVMGALGFLFYQVYMESKDLKETNANLENENQTLQASSKKQTSSKTPATSEISYSAKVGKFTLKLPSDYAVIEKLDGGGEGGQATSLLIAKKVKDKDNTFKATYLRPFEILASTTTETLDELAKRASSDFSSADSKSTIIAKEEGRILTLGGLGTEKRVVFIHNGISFIVSYDGDNPEGESYYTDFVKGFSFN